MTTRPEQIIKIEKFSVLKITTTLNLLKFILFKSSNCFNEQRLSNFDFNLVF